MVEKIHAMKALKTVWQETTLMGELNRTLRGWANYFQVGSAMITIPTAHASRDDALGVGLVCVLLRRHHI